MITYCIVGYLRFRALVSNGEVVFPGSLGEEPQGSLEWCKERAGNSLAKF